MPGMKAGVAPSLIASASSPRDFPDEPLDTVGALEIAFLGRSNVGKSTLLNTLVRKPGLAFTSAKPGRTQMINFFDVQPGIHFVDLPGYGYAKVPLAEKERWRKLVEAYLLKRKSLALCFLLLDARRGWMDMDLELKQWLEFHNRRYQVIATKVDKLSKNQGISELARIRKQLHDQEPVPFSALDGRGVRETWQIISKIRNKQ
jgi:GTP-binding protein